MPLESLELLHQVLAAEKNARKSCERARSDKRAAENTELLRRRAEEDAMKAARRQVEEAEQEALASVEDAIRAEDRRCRETMEELAARFAEKKEECTERMFRMAVGIE